MRKFALVLTSLTTLGIAASAQAQGPSVGDIAGYLALSTTPAGAMTPTVTNAMLGRISKSYEIAGRYAHLSQDGGGFNSFGASASMPVSGFTLGGTLGYWSSSCDGCDGSMMLGLNAETNLSSMKIGEGKNPNRLNIGARGDFGWGNPKEGTTSLTSLGLSAVVPVTLVLRNGSMTFAPFITPGMGWGRISADGSSESGTRPLMGLGLGMMNANGWGVSVGMQKVFIDQGKSVFGLNVSYGK